MAQGGQIEPFQDIQRLQQGDSLGPGTVGEYLVATVGCRNGFFQRRLILGEVFIGVQPAQFLQGFHHSTGQVAPVENVPRRLNPYLSGLALGQCFRFGLGHQGQRPTQVFLEKHSAQHRRPAVGQVDAGRVRVLLQVGHPVLAADGATEQLVGREAVGGEI